jgi:chromosome segregation ATPase
MKTSLSYKFVACCFAIFLAVSNAHDDVDCNVECQAQVAAAVEPLRAESLALTGQLGVAQNDLKAAKELVGTLEGQVANMVADMESVRQESDKLRRVLDQAREEALKHHQQADENMRATVDANGKLSDATSMIAQLEELLSSAKEEIAQLGSVSFASQLQKETMVILDGIKTTWVDLKGKLFASKTKENDDL